jgi:glycosyltransferase involved in cell wall biosynthesis
VRVAHVVTLVSVDGAFGGPVSVARTQCQALAELGHDVELFAGWDGCAELEVPGVETRLFRTRRVLPMRGFAPLIAPGLSRELVGSRPRFDVVHVHLARDFVTLAAGRACAHAAVPFVVQTHGMVREDRRAAARLLDATLTRKVLRGARAQLALTEEEARDLPMVSRAPSNVIRMQNGVRLTHAAAAWTDGIPTVVFCARLHARKRPAEFVRMAGVMRDRGIAARFRIFGPDQGELAAVRDLIATLDLTDRVEYGGALRPEDVSRTLLDAQVYVLPSVDEPFPMGLLEAMSLGLPSVITDSTGVSDALRTSGAALVTDGTAQSLADAVATLVSGPAVWSKVSTLAKNQIVAQYSDGAMSRALVEVYESLAT